MSVRIQLHQFESGNAYRCDVADELVSDRDGGGTLAEDSGSGARLQSLDAGKVPLDDVDRAGGVDNLSKWQADQGLGDGDGVRSHREGESEQSEEGSAEHLE